MSTRRNGRPKANMSVHPPRDTSIELLRSPARSAGTSPPRSCVTSDDEILSYSSSPEITTSMVLVGCPRCLMYVMLSEDTDQKCPKCKSTLLLEFVHGNDGATSSSRDRAASNRRNNRCNKR